MASVHVSDILLQTVNSPDRTMLEESELNVTFTMDDGRKRRTTEASHRYRTCLLFLLYVATGIGLVAGLVYYFHPFENHHHSVSKVIENINNNHVNSDVDKFSVQAKYYRLRLQPNLQNLNYTGTTDIYFKTLSITNTLVLAASRLNVSRVELSYQETVELDNQKRAKIFNVSIRTIKLINNELIVSLNSNLEMLRDYLLSMDFSGQIANKTQQGFYWNTYKDQGGFENIFATSNFVADHHMPFPCFIKPRFKAKFDVAIARRTKMSSLSNMPLKATETIENVTSWVWDHFKTSPPILPNELVITITNFKNLNVTLNNGIVVQLWAPKHLVEYCRFALKTTVDLIEFYEKTLNEKLGVAKLDVLLVPHLLSNSGRLGLISMSETSLLNYNNLDNLKIVRGVFNQLATIIARQFNRTRQHTDEHTNQGTALYLANVAENQLHPEWNTTDYLIYETADRIFTNRLENVSTEKYACLLNNDASNLDDWLHYNAVPLINLTRSNDTLMVRIEQTVFPTGRPSNLLIELNYATQNGSGQLNEINMSTTHIETNLLLPKNEFVLFNINRKGIYRVNYDATNWNLIAEQLSDDFHAIPVLTRAQLIDDAFALAREGLANYTLPFKMIRYLANSGDEEFMPWKTTLDALDFIGNVLQPTSHYNHYQRFLVNLLEKTYNDTSSNPHVNDLVQNLIVVKMCQVSYERCTKIALEKHEKNEVKSISNELQYIVFCTAIEKKSDAVWEHVWSETQSNRNNAFDLHTYYLALGCTRNPWRISQYLENTLNETISIENHAFVWRSIAGRTIGNKIGMEFIEHNWQSIDALNTRYPHVWRTIANEFLRKFTTDGDLNILRLFYQRIAIRNLPLLDALLVDVIEQVQETIQWREKYVNDVLREFML